MIPLKVYVGTSGYGYKEWQGKFYPEKISPKEMLRFYSERLNAVEINNTFYHMPKEGVLASWAEQVSENFVFALKAPQIITHLKQLRNVSAETRYLFRSLSVLGRKLGPILFQLPKSFSADRTALEDFLTLIPDNVSCAFEFRNPSWQTAEIMDLLKERQYILCIADTDENHMSNIIGTAHQGYLRLRRSDYTDADLSRWKTRILSQKWERVFVFFKHEEEAKGAEIAMHFHEIILRD